MNFSNRTFQMSYKSWLSIVTDEKNIMIMTMVMVIGSVMMVVIMMWYWLHTKVLV